VPDPELGSTIFGASLTTDVEIGGIQSAHMLARVAQTDDEAAAWCGAAFALPPLAGAPAGPYVSLTSNDTAVNVSVLFTAATWYNGRVVWRTQSVWYCAHGASSWVDVTAHDCVATQRSEQAVDLRVCGRAAPNGTFVRVDTHDRDWSTTCVGDTTGCGCTSGSVDVPHAIVLTAIALAFLACTAATLSDDRVGAVPLVALVVLTRYRTTPAVATSGVAVALGLVPGFESASETARLAFAVAAIGLCALGGVLELALDAGAPYAESTMAGAAIMAAVASALARAAPDVFATRKLATASLLGMAGAAAERQPIAFHTTIVLLAALFFALLLRTTKTAPPGALLAAAATLALLSATVTPCTYN
jgi:hypothetical protein